MSWSPWTISTGVGEMREAASAGGIGSGVGQPSGEIRVFSTRLLNARPRRRSAAR
jgi:hypothetical protein